MGKLKHFVLAIFIVSLAQAQLPNAYPDLIHVQTARTLNPGALTINGSMNFYTKAGEFIGETKPVDFSAVNYWLVAGNAIFSYGIVDHFDASLGIRVYQDTHRSNESNIPGDLFLTLRAGSFAFGRDHFNQAFLISTRFPVAEQHNYLYAEYASGAIEYGFMYSVSFYSDKYLRDRYFNLHFNVGYWNHNEAGQTFSFENDTEYKAGHNSQEFRMGLASIFPSRLFDYRLELTGMIYIKKPEGFIYSAGEWLVLTPSIKYKMAPWVALDLGMDFRLSPDREWTTENIPKPSNLDLPKTYPPWKVQLGANFVLNLKEKTIVTAEDVEREEAREKIELFEQILDEREKAKEVEKELENLKKIRKEAEEEIEELKKILED